MRKDLEDYLWECLPTLKQREDARLAAGLVAMAGGAIGDRFFAGDSVLRQLAPTPRDTIQEMYLSGMIASPKQAWRTLEKWCRKGRYSYGVSLDLGWKEE